MSYFSLFQSTHPARGATRSGFLTPTVDQFQSTHPARGATIAAISSGLSTSFQSTHPARGATVRRPPFCFHFDISIHAPREGCDFAPRNDGGMWVISIHAPREGCDSSDMWICSMTSRFQSTHPARGATPYWCVLARPAFHFNPRTPRGVRQVADGPPGDCVIISIHAPREGCDKAPLAGGTKERNFNPRTPRGVRLFGVLTKNRSLDFNPRTPRGVRRAGVAGGGHQHPNFNPRTPRGVRRSGCGTSQCPPRFQSTHPARGATTGMPWRSSMERFQSTHPARGATGSSSQRRRTPDISIHAPREGCDANRGR